MAAKKMPIFSTRPPIETEMPTMTKQNCWEFMNCGREEGGIKVPECGVCPATTDTLADGIHSGRNGGRSCWALVGSFSVLDRRGGNKKCTKVAEGMSCLDCEFYYMVMREEGSYFLTGVEIIERLSAERCR